MEHLLSVIWLLTYPISWVISNYISSKRYKLEGRLHPKLTASVAIVYLTMYYGIAYALW